jgi:hypothetical protein
MKHGANFRDQNEIARLAREGADAATISAKLQIAQTCVEAFMPGEKPAAKTARKPAAKTEEPAGE